MNQKTKKQILVTADGRLNQKEVNDLIISTSLRIRDLDDVRASNEACSTFLRNLCQEKLVGNAAENVLQDLDLWHLNLDEWEPLANFIRRSQIQVLFLLKCNLTPTGALVLINLLSSQDCKIKNFVSTQGDGGSIDWMAQALRLNRSITRFNMGCLRDQNQESWQDIVLAVLHKREIREFHCRNVMGNEGFGVQISASSLTDHKTLSIDFRDGRAYENVALCRSIGVVLQGAPQLEKLLLYLPYEPFATQYIFLRDVTDIGELYLSRFNCDPQIVADLIIKGNLKKFSLGRFQDSSRSENLATFFRLLSENLSLLDSLSIGCMRDDQSLHALSNLLQQNRGPRKLEIIWDESDKSPATAKLAKSMHGNTKIQVLTIEFLHATLTAFWLQYIPLIGNMPNLMVWDVRFFSSRPMVGLCQNLLVEHALSKKNEIREIHIESKFTEIQDCIQMIFACKQLLRDEIILPDGVWANAFARIRRLDVMYCLLKEVPRIIKPQYIQRKDTGITAKESRILHCPECPACRSQQVKSGKQS